MFSRPEASHNEVLRQLRRAIIQGRLKPGEQIRQEKLAQSFGLSRVPIREALKTLAGERLVIHEPNRGFFVTTLSSEGLAETYCARGLLETEILSSLKIDDIVQELDRLEALYRAMEVARKQSAPDDFASANRDFHFVILDSAVRPILTDLVRQLWDSSEAYRSYLFASTRLQKINAEHKLMIEAIRNRDLISLGVLLDTHRSAAIMVMRETLAESS